jgi:hypothetical protein
MVSKILQRGKWPITAAATLILFTLLWVAGQRTYSGMLDHLIEKALTTWESSRSSPPSPTEVRQYIEMFATAKSLTPNDPRLLARGARLHRWHAWIHRDDDSRYQESLQQALEEYRQSLRARPGWPYTWLDFASTKARAGEFDTEFQSAFANALELGPWEMSIQREIGQLGLAHWRKISEENRQRMEQNLINAMSLQKEEFLRGIERSDNLLLFCFAYQKKPEIAEFCESKQIY